MKITDEMTYHLMAHLQTDYNSVVVPNVRYRGFEMDVVKYKSSGEIHEYEIKSNYYNFASDKNKTCSYINFWNSVPALSNFEVAIQTHIKDKGGRPLYDKYLKHRLIHDGDYGIDKFTYVCPVDVIPKNEVHDLYGLIYYCDKQKKFYTIKTASRIRVKDCMREKDFMRILIQKISRLMYSNRVKIHRLMNNEDSFGYTKKALITK